MTRAPEHPATTEAEPMTDHEPEELWEEQVEGETPDTATRQALNLAHRAAEKFPELAQRYRSFAGPVVVASGALMALAGVAVARRLRRGQQPDEIIDQITPDEIERAATSTRRKNRLWRMVLRIAKRRGPQNETSEPSS